MKAIWKFPLVPGAQTIPVPPGAQPLCAQTQDENVVLWALVDPGPSTYPGPPASLRVLVVATGQPLDSLEGMRYLSTVQIPGGKLGTLVFHVFVEGGDNPRKQLGLRLSDLDGS